MNIEEINNEIQRLELQETTYENCSKLSILYIVRDHFKTRPRFDSSYASSEFMQACAHSDIESVMRVLDEHMNCIKVIYPKEYSKILSKIKERGAF